MGKWRHLSKEIFGVVATLPLFWLVIVPVLLVFGVIYYPIVVYLFCSLLVGCFVLHAAKWIWIALKWLCALSIRKHKYDMQAATAQGETIGAYAGLAAALLVFVLCLVRVGVPMWRQLLQILTK